MIFESMIVYKIKIDFNNIPIQQKTEFCAKKSIIYNLIPYTEHVASSMSMDARVHMCTLYTMSKTYLIMSIMPSWSLNYHHIKYMGHYGDDLTGK